MVIVPALGEKSDSPLGADKTFDERGGAGDTWSAQIQGSPAPGAECQERRRGPHVPNHIPPLWPRPKPVSRSKPPIFRGLAHRVVRSVPHCRRSLGRRDQGKGHRHRRGRGARRRHHRGERDHRGSERGRDRSGRRLLFPGPPRRHLPGDRPRSWLFPGREKYHAGCGR